MNNGKICVSVCAETADEFIKGIERAAQIADVVELRFDCLTENEFEAILVDLVILRRKAAKPFLGTFRPKTEYADLTPVRRKYKDDNAKELHQKETKKRLDVWKRILENNAIEWIDIEHDLQNALCWNIAIDAVWTDKQNLDWELEFANKLKNRRLIVSEHFFDKIPNNLDAVFTAIAVNLKDEEQPIEEVEVLTNGIVKIAVQANGATDGLELMKLLGKAKAENKQLIPIAMGESGIWTRIIGLSRGAFITFASLDDKSKTAPGQLTAQEMIDVYRVKELDENTEIFGLIGESVAHSVSPQMHNAAFKFNNLNAVYIPFAVKNLGEFMRRMVNPATREIDWNARGFAVTIPHKIEIMKYLDEMDETARKIGAVNTVKIDENGKLLGFNTDAAGFIEPLKNAYGDLKNVKVAVLGAGGAARAVVYALKQENAEVTIFARNPTKAQSLADEFAIEVRELAADNYSDFQILVNTTPLGMRKGNLENETPATAEQLENVKLVYDLVYNPFQTKLMREADRVFVPTIGGLAMLVAQAMRQQQIWTGKNAPMKEMSRAALRKLEQ